MRASAACTTELWNLRAEARFAKMAHRCPGLRRRRVAGGFVEKGKAAGIARSCLIRQDPGRRDTKSQKSLEALTKPLKRAVLFRLSGVLSGLLMMLFMKAAAIPLESSTLVHWATVNQLAYFLLVTLSGY